MRLALDSVECSANQKQHTIKPEVAKYRKYLLTTYKYKDDFIEITWYMDSHTEQFNFLLENKSDQAMKINWDDVSFIDFYGMASGVIYSDHKMLNIYGDETCYADLAINPYNIGELSIDEKSFDKNKLQVPTTIPKHSKILGMLVPKKNISFNKEGKGYIEDLLGNTYYLSSYMDKTIKLYIPIVIGTMKCDYSFIFNLYKDNIQDYKK